MGGYSEGSDQTIINTYSEKARETIPHLDINYMDRCISYTSTT